MILVTLVLSTGPVRAWWRGGHGILPQAAVQALPKDKVPAFFRQADKAVAHYVFDPDIAKNRATQYLRNAEHSEHYMDIELLKGAEIPKGRYDFIRLCAKLDVSLNLSALSRTLLPNGPNGWRLLLPNIGSGRITPIFSKNVRFMPALLPITLRISVSLYTRLSTSTVEPKQMGLPRTVVSMKKSIR